MQNTTEGAFTHGYHSDQHARMHNTAPVTSPAPWPFRHVCFKCRLEASACSKWLSKRASVDVEANKQRTTPAVQRVPFTRAVFGLAGWKRRDLQQINTAVRTGTHSAGPCCVIWGQKVKICLASVTDEPRHPVLCPGVLLLACLFCSCNRPHTLGITGLEEFMGRWAASLICLALWQTFPALLILINGGLESIFSSSDQESELVVEETW